MSATSVTSASPEQIGTDHNTVRISIPAILTVIEAAAVLTLSVRATRQLIADGKLPTFRLGRRRIVRRADLEKLTGTKLA